MKQLSTTQIQSISGGLSNTYFGLLFITSHLATKPIFYKPIFAATSSAASDGYAEFKKEWYGHGQPNSPTPNSWANHQPQATPPIDSCLLKDCKISS